MGKFRLFTHSVILATTPSFLIYPQDAFRQTDFHVQEVHSRVPKNFRKTGRYQLASYDDILNFLEEVESGTKDYREKDLRRINRFLTYLASESVLPNSDNAHELRKDIDDLLADDGYAFTDLDEDDYAIIPAVGGEAADILLCKSKLSKKWKKTKKFIKKHKKEIIIGAVIVVVTATVVVAVVVTSSAGAAAAAAGAAGAASSSKSSKEEKRKPAQVEDSDLSRFEDTRDVVEATNAAPTLKAIIDGQIHEYKEFLIEDQLVQQSNPSQEWNDLSFGEKAREVGAHFAHQAYQEVADLVSVVPQLCDEIKGLGTKLLPEDLTPPNNELSGDPKANFENLMAKSHEAIDKVFSTDQAELFTAEARENDPTNNFAIGLIPFPGVFSGGKFDVKKLSNAGKVVDRGGFTKVERNLMKHGYREGSVFPKPLGNPAQVNAHGQRVLESILNHPEKQLFPAEFDRYGKVVDIYAPGLGGARYSASGEFIGFLEP